MAFFGSDFCKNPNPALKTPITYDINNNPLPNNHFHLANEYFNINPDEVPWFGLEQEYFFVQNNWDSYLVNKYNSHSDCGYLCMVIREPAQWNKFKKHAGSSVGIASTENLMKIYSKYGKLPSLDENLVGQYVCKGENEFGTTYFTKFIELAGILVVYIKKFLTIMKR